MKKLGKKLIVSILASKVRKLRAKHQFKIIAVTGSIGKTSTKFAVATVLKQKYRVQFQEGNYNDIVSIPLVFFGLPIPSLMNPLAWVKTFAKINKQIKSDYPYDVVVLELGTDGPGQIEHFSAYIQADLSIVTAITPEHMEYFADLEAVAAEELSVTKFSKQTIVNLDLCNKEYLAKLPTAPLTYGIKNLSSYQIVKEKFNNNSYEFEVQKVGKSLMKVNQAIIAESQLYTVLAAVAAGDMFGLTPDDINKGLQLVQPVSGRMQRLAGANDSIIIDDTYNASPDAVKGALDTLYRLPAPQKIAILGNMNELGKYSQSAHTEIGEYCDPKNLTLLATIGADANAYLATAAQKKGVNVKTFNSPYEIGKYIRPLIQKGTIILAKGSQNGVFAEEAVKLLLADPEDSKNLIRQSDTWLKIKKKQFADAT